MPHLHRLSEHSTSPGTDLDAAGMSSLIGSTAYLEGGHAAGTVRDVLVDDQVGKIRYLLIDDAGGTVEGATLIPIGLTRLEGDGVYLDGVTPAQLTALHRYSSDEEYSFDLMSGDERVLRGDTETIPSVTMPASGYDYRDHDEADTLYKTPQTLQLLEERLQVNKQRAVAGSVEIGKRVETRTENVNVGLEHEELVIERTAVSEPRPVEGHVTLGDGAQTMRVDLEAETAQLNKQAFVTEEVAIGKRTVTEQQTLSDTVGREVLDVTKSGEITIDDETESPRSNR